MASEEMCVHFHQIQVPEEARDDQDGECARRDDISPEEWLPRLAPLPHSEESQDASGHDRVRAAGGPECKRVERIRHQEQDEQPEQQRGPHRPQCRPKTVGGSAHGKDHGPDEVEVLLHGKGPDMPRQA